MVEPSENSTVKGRRNTGKTAKVTQEEALEILQSSLKMCQEAGIEVQIVPTFYAGGFQYVGALLANVQFINGNLCLITGNLPENTGKL